MALEDLLAPDQTPPQPSGGGSNPAPQPGTPEYDNPQEAEADLAMIQQQLDAVKGEASQYKAMVDKLLDVTGKAAPETKVDNEELIAQFEQDPQAFIARVAQQAIENHPKLKGVTETVETLEARDAKKELKSKFENYEEVISSTGFKQYVQANPTIGKLLIEANNANDAATVASILKLYNDVAGTATDAGGPKGNPANSGRGVKTGSGGGTSGKIYSRDAIKKLIVENPAEYARLQTEIDRAYAEGRVK